MCFRQGGARSGQGRAVSFKRGMSLEHRVQLAGEFRAKFLLVAKGIDRRLRPASIPEFIEGGPQAGRGSGPVDPAAGKINESRFSSFDLPPDFVLDRATLQDAE